MSVSARWPLFRFTVTVKYNFFTIFYVFWWLRSLEIVTTLSRWALLWSCLKTRSCAAAMKKLLMECLKNALEITCHREYNILFLETFPSFRWNFLSMVLVVLSAETIGYLESIFNINGHGAGLPRRLPVARLLNLPTVAQISAGQGTNYMNGVELKIWDLTWVNSTYITQLREFSWTCLLLMPVGTMWSIHESAPVSAFESLDTVIAANPVGWRESGEGECEELLIYGYLSSWQYRVFLCKSIIIILIISCCPFSMIGSRCACIMW